MDSRTGSKFRSEIEGLRAFAVLSVLLNHAYPSLLPGGFSGVDIFFVISGYLIGRQLLLDNQEGSFSFLAFYARRARRIFPALAAMLISIWCAGFLILTDSEFGSLGKHMAAAAVFINNFALSAESGYFDTQAATKPLLHLWSLGIEEQFYLLVPGLLWLGANFERRPLAWVVRLGVLSLVATLLLADIHPASSYYLLHTRFWELAAGVCAAHLEMSGRTQRSLQGGLGAPGVSWELVLASIGLVFAILAHLIFGQTALRDAPVSSYCGIMLLLAGTATMLIEASPRREFRVISEFIRPHREVTNGFLALVGLSILCVSNLVSAPTDWPGPQTVLLVLGALLIVAGPSNSIPAHLLSSKAMVFVGGISYPLYLWHWPALYLWRITKPESTSAELLIPLGISFVLAWLTKALIEDPIRLSRLGTRSVTRLGLWVVLIPLALAGLIGLITFVSKGLPARFSPGLRAIAEWSEPVTYGNWRMNRCYHNLDNGEGFAPECTPPKRVDAPLVLLWGDSHAAHLYPGLVDLNKRQQFDLAQWTTGSCPPTFIPINGEGRSCVQRRGRVLGMLKQQVPDTVVLSGAWEIYLSSGNSRDAIVNAVADSVRHLTELGAKRVVVFGPGPTWSSSLPTDLFRFMIRTGTDQTPERLGRVSREVRELDAAIALRMSTSQASYFSVLDTLCNEAGCLTIGDRSLRRPDLLFWDRDHLTVTGSKLIVQHAKSVILEQ